MKKFLFLSAPFLYIFLLLLHLEKAFTQDLGRHLVLGKIIVSCFCIPDTNLFSYTAPQFPFINHHWIPEVIFFFIYSVLNPNTLLLFKILLITLSFLIVFYIAIKKSNIVIASALSIPFLFIFSERFDLRPEIFSFVFISLYLFCLTQYLGTQEKKYLIFLPLVQLLWVNSHIYFFIGPLLFTFLFVDQVLKKKVTKYVSIVGILILISCLLNPQYLHGALYPFQVFGNYGYAIVENQNIFFLNGFSFNPRILVFEIVVLVFLLLSGLHLFKKNYFDFFCLIFAAAAGMMMIRNFSVFFLVGFPACSALLFILYQNAKTSSQKNFEVSIISISIFFGIITGIQALNLSSFGFGYVQGAENAVNFVEKNKLPGRIFNNFDIGSYLIYRLYPKYPVFVDGRPEAYPKEFFDLYRQMQTDSQLFEQQVIRYDIHTIFFAVTDITPWAQQFLQTIVQDPAWSAIYFDGQIVIFVQNIPENAELIDKYSIQLSQ